MGFKNIMDKIAGVKFVKLFSLQSTVLQNKLERWNIASFFILTDYLTHNRRACDKHSSLFRLTVSKK
jgi:hypothetical protein